MELGGNELEKAIGAMLEDEHMSKRYRICFNNEFYPALIPVGNRMVLLHKAVEGLIKRGALRENNLDIVKITERLAPHWFINSESCHDFIVREPWKWNFEVDIKYRFI